MLAGGNMEILAALKQEEAKLQHQLTGIRSAIAALGGSYSGGGYGSGVAKRGGRGKRVVSAALRAHLSRKAKERWAKIRADKAKGKK
jgi:hypothetical protein